MRNLVAWSREFWTDHLAKAGGPAQIYWEQHEGVSELCHKLYDAHL